MATQAESINLFEINVNVDAAINDTRKLREEVDLLKAQTKKAKEELGETSDEYIKYSAELRNAQKDLKAQETMNQKISESRNEEIGTLKRLEAQNSALRAEQKKLNLDSEEGLKRNKEIVNQINANTEAIKSYSDEQSKARQSVGGYAAGIEEAAGAMGGLGGASGQAISGLKAIGTAAKFALGPIGLIISAIALVVGAVKSFFTSTQEGQDKLKKLQAIFKLVFGYLNEILADIGKKIVAVFENPKEAILSFFKLLKENIINRFEGLLELIPALAKSIGLLFKGEFKEAGKVAADAVLKVTTGVENATDKITAFGQKAKDAYDQISAAIARAVLEAERLRKAEIALEEANIRATKSLAELNKQAELQSAIADDSTKSFEERQKAADLSRKASEEAALVAIDLAQKELAIINIKNEQLEANGQLLRENQLEQAEAQAKLIDAEKNFTLIKQNNAKQRAEIDRDLFEKNLDYLLDNFDNIKTINEQIAADDKQSFEKRLEIIESTKQLGEQAFAEQIKQLQTRTNETINANDLINESDSKRLIEKVRLLKLDEIEETRLLEVLRDRRTAINDLATAERDILEAQYEYKQELANNARAYEESELARMQEIEAAYLENKSIAERDNILAQFEWERQQLELQYEQEIAYAERIGADVSSINEKYAQFNKEIAQAELQAKAQLATDFFANLATIFGENTKFGRIAAATSASISAIQGAVASYTSLAGIPIVGPALGATAAAAALASGFANVKKIYATKSGLPGDSGGGSGSTPSISTPTTVSQSQSVTPEIGQGILTRQSLLGQQAKQSLQPTLVVDSVTSAQTNQSEINQTSTI